MTQSKIDVERVTVTSNSRTLSSEWKFEQPQEPEWVISDEVVKDMAALIGKEIVDSYKELWNNCMPDHYLLRDLCDEYPGVDGAFKQFESAYALVINDWKLKSGSTANDKLLYAINNYEESWGVEVYELKHMTKEYSVLDKAFEQFKTAWNLVIDDWKSSKK